MEKFSKCQKTMSQQRQHGNLTEEAIKYLENGSYASDCSANRREALGRRLTN